ncbi:MAG: nucleotidyltransferase family protein [Aestuariivirgaceae bacterium]
MLAAGLGTRLRPLTDHVPKCLVPIRGRPLLDYWLSMLFDGGIEAALVNTHHLADEVRRFVLSSPWRDRVSLVHEDRLLGTAGTILQNRDFFAGQPCMVIHADNLSMFDVPAFVAHHVARPSGTALTMMTFDTDVPETCGIVTLDRHGVVQEMHEKVAHPPGRRANAAVYILEPAVIDFIASLGRPIVDLSTEVLPHFMGRISAFHNTGYHRDIGSPESLRKAEAETGARYS